ncbi:unnamed protein product [Miscanthus lutarioriparius]|uniref:RNA polymerase II C-terminal domain phosphatase-like n=1 Tax=Miscanthus lutarioriparius TaxID=422564 RepID=A0A811PDU7_9POAL|nr:unnamed protein product [Miscanthus lutarioriparius]
MAGRGSRRRRCRRRKSTIKQGGNGDGDGDARCPPDPGFVSGAMEEDTEGAAPCPSHRVLSFLGLDATKERGAEGGASGKIREGPAAVPASTSTSIPRASDLETLLRTRKLTLILDLDHTLLDSTGLDDRLSPVEQANGLTRHAKSDPTAGLFRLGSARVRMLTKLRPFARGFLEQASAMFEMCVYTLGNRDYARAVVKLLDPDGAYFGGRVVSRDESTRQDSKSLDVVPGAEAAAVVILDDSSDVWPDHQENLILMHPYLYFADSCRTFGYGVLTRVHQGFFDSVLRGRCSDVREVIRAVRREVLRGCTVAFSRLIPLEDVSGEHPMLKLAKQLGAVHAADADATVTHVVALDPRTDKARWARDNGKFLVNPMWIMAASFRWSRPCEQEFSFPSHPRPWILLMYPWTSQFAEDADGDEEGEDADGDGFDNGPMSTSSRKRRSTTDTLVKLTKGLTERRHTKSSLQVRSKKT